MLVQLEKPKRNNKSSSTKKKVTRETAPHENKNNNQITSKSKVQIKWTTRRPEWPVRVCRLAMNRFPLAHVYPETTAITSHTMQRWYRTRANYAVVLFLLFLFVLSSFIHLVRPKKQNEEDEEVLLLPPLPF